MNPLRKFHPDLQACELEDRLLPVIANLGVIVLTTGGYVLMIPGVLTILMGRPSSLPGDRPGTKAASQS